MRVEYFVRVRGLGFAKGDGGLWNQLPVVHWGSEIPTLVAHASVGELKNGDKPFFNSIGIDDRHEEFCCEEANRS